MRASPQSVPQVDGPVHLSLQVPGSKSLTCRALILAALASGTSTLRGGLRGDDTESLAKALISLGIPIDWQGPDIVVQGGGPLHAPAEPIDVGHGGTPARFMLAMASLAQGVTCIDGSDRLRERPMADMVILLNRLGVHVEATHHEGHLPLSVTGANWNGNPLQVGQTASSQFLSALLLVAPATELGLTMHLHAPPTSGSYFMMTLEELRRWGVPISVARGQDPLMEIGVQPTRPTPCEREIAGDASSALFWAVAASIIPGSVVSLPRVHLGDGQPDAAAFEVLAAMGVPISQNADAAEVRGPDTLRAVPEIDCQDFPDAVPALAVACAFASETTRLRGLHTLRLKESDRIAAIATELGNAGVQVDIVGDDLIIHPADPPDDPITCQTYDDHRIAMAMAVMGLRRGGVSIEDPDCVSKSYPAFWADLATFAAAGLSGDTAP